MKQRPLVLLVSIAAIAVLGIAYIALSARPKPTVMPAIKDLSIPLWKIDKNTLVKFVLSGRAGSDLKAEKRGGAWTVDYSRPVILNGPKLDEIAYTLTDLTAERIVEEAPTDLARYGLAPPRAAAHAVFSDGESRTFYIGDPTPAGSTFYLLVKGDPRVYSVWKTVAEHAFWTVSDLRERSILPAIYSDEINYFYLRLSDGAEIEIRRKTRKETADPRLGSGKFYMTRPYNQPRGINYEKAVHIIRGPAGIEIADFIDDAPKDLSIFGLDRPRFEAIVRDNAVDYRFLFGAEAGTERVYFKLAGKPEVYTVDRKRLAFLNVKAFDIIEKWNFGPPIDAIDRIEITAAGKTHILTLTRTHDASGKTHTVYRGDGKEFEELSFHGFYKTLGRLAIDGEATNPPTSEVALRTRFFLNEGAPREVVVEYARYDRDFYSVLVDRTIEFAVSSAQIDAMLDALARLLAGERLTP